MSALLIAGVVGALAGGVTAALGIVLAFYPIRPIGRKPFHVQGLIPRLGARIVYLLTQNLYSDPSNLQRLIKRITVADVMGIAQRRLGVDGYSIVEQTLRAINPKHWDRLRKPVKEQWITRLQPSIPTLISKIFERIQDNPSLYIHVPTLACDMLNREPQLLGHKVWQLARLDFIKVVLFAAALGALLASIGTWANWAGKQLWIVGSSAGVLSAAWMLVSLNFPRKRVHFMQWTIQGILYRHQDEIARSISVEMSRRLMSLDILSTHITTGGKNFRDLCCLEIANELIRATNGSTTLLALSLGAQSVQQAVDAMTAEMVANTPKILSGALPADAENSVRVQLLDDLSRLPTDTLGDLLTRPMLLLGLPFLLLGAAVGGLLGRIFML